jgi:DNA-binding GntR family transcriptional regulator
MISDAGMKPEIKVLNLVARPAQTEEARALELTEDEEVRSLERLRTADGQPVIYSLDVMPAHLVEDITEKKFERSLYEVLKRAGHQVVSASAVLLPVVADVQLADVLRVDVGSAIQQITEIDYTRSGHPILRSTEWHVPGFFELRVNRRP